MSVESPIGNNGPGQIISSVRSIRIAIFLISNALIATCAIFNSVFVENIAFVHAENFTNETVSNEAMKASEFEDIPSIYLFLCGLSLSAVSAFLRSGFILKLFTMILTVILQTLVLYTSTTFEQYELNQTENK